MSQQKSYSLELARKVELDMLEVHLRHLQHISAVRQEHIPTLAVFRHVLVFALLEGFQFSRIIALNPATATAPPYR